MTRPIWKGYITFGLVNIPITLYSAEKKFDIQLKLIDSRDKAKIHYMRINEHTGEEVAWSDVAKGYEYEKNNYILLKEADIKAIAGEHSKTIDIANFVDKNSLEMMDYEKPYYLVPDKKGEKAYVILREVLKNTKKIGISKVVIHTREYLAALIPCKNALILNLLRYHQELRKISEFDFPSENIKNYKISKKEMEVAKQLVASMTCQWKPAMYHDEYREALEKYVANKVHHKIKKTPKSKPLRTNTNVINFVDLLKKSLEKNKKTLPHKKNKPVK
ncbi:MAG: Ku protein [Rickettsia endosymbiont of Ixodes persulcatus]|nr:Ku protein [Rickettsia endosymbiont of Ixodes persulcatus]